MKTLITLTIMAFVSGLSIPYAYPSLFERAGDCSSELARGNNAERVYDLFKSEDTARELAAAELAAAECIKGL